MRGLLEELKREEKHLVQIIEEIKKRQVESPIEGKLWISSNRGKPQFYHCKENSEMAKEKGKSKQIGTYIPKSDVKLAARLAQNDYEKAVIKCAEKRLKQMQAIIRDYDDDELEHIYTCLHSVRQELIQPIEPTWDQKLKDWYQKAYVGKEFHDNVPIIYTEKGERVRSKSEKILADFFYHHGILYKYECPLYLTGVGLVYPDFTFLSRKTGKEMYWEHEGKMNDPLYVEQAIRKINSYQSNGILVGKDLILTFETEKTVLNMKAVEIMAEQYLL